MWPNIRLTVRDAFGQQPDRKRITEPVGGLPNTIRFDCFFLEHPRKFSIIRDLMLANSAVILQDDSGIPYHCFGADLWKLQLYGDYTQPYGSFRFLVQPDLRKAYQTAPARPLPMHIGYGYRKITCNLLLAKRVTPAAVH